MIWQGFSVVGSLGTGALRVHTVRPTLSEAMADSGLLIDDKPGSLSARKSYIPSDSRLRRVSWAASEGAFLDCVLRVGMERDQPAVAVAQRSGAVEWTTLDLEPIRAGSLIEWRVFAPFSVHDLFVFTFDFEAL